MPEPKRPLKVFLCHAHADRDPVRALYSRLTNDGVDAWLDKEKLLPGQDWELEIRKAVREADVVIVCLSKQFNQKGYRQWEVRIALEEAAKQPEGEIFIIPARLEECDTLESLKKWHWVDLFEDDGYEMLMRALRIRVNKIGEGLRTNKAVKPTEKTPKSTYLVGGVISLVLLAVVLSFAMPSLIRKLEAAPTAINNETATSDLTYTIQTSTKAPTNFPTLGIGSTLVSEKDGMTMLYVPAGKFIMGGKAEDALAECQKYRVDCQLDWFKDEEPPHEVDLAAFWIYQTEVTNAMYAKCVQEGACKTAANFSSNKQSSYYGNSNFANYPVVYVNWDMARGYCEWAISRLPTEAEWEKTARGTDGRRYPWGNHSPNEDLLNYNQNIGDTTHVGIYLQGQSVYGALDMAGNVWEWVSSVYKPYPYDVSDGREDINSVGDRVQRGGSWYFVGGVVRSAYRNVQNPTDVSSSVGFRCARDIYP